MTQDKFESLETHLAHLDKTVDELSDVVNKQQDDAGIDRYYPS